MQLQNIAIPILPSRSVAATAEFYKLLGFEESAHEADSEYAILSRGTVELHFFTHRELAPSESFAGCYIRVTDVEGIHQLCAAAKLPSKGIPRIEPLESKPWGLREFAVIDLDGNLLRIGQALDE